MATPLPLNVEFPYALQKETQLWCFAQSCTKKDGPFICLHCSEPMVLHRGSIKKPHFSHKAKINANEKTISCASANKESFAHLAAKKWIAENASACTFLRNCSLCKTNIFKILYQEIFSKTTVEHRVIHTSKLQDNQKTNYVVDVALRKKSQKISAVVEVYYKHKISNVKRQHLHELFGNRNVHEINALDVLNYMEAPKQNAYLLNDMDPEICTTCFQQRVKQETQRQEMEKKKLEEKLERELKWELERPQREADAKQKKLDTIKKKEEQKIADKKFRELQKSLGLKDCQRCSKWLTKNYFYLNSSLCNLCEAQNKKEMAKFNRPCIECNEWYLQFDMHERAATEHDDTKYKKVYVCEDCSTECPNCESHMTVSNKEKYKLCSECNRDLKTSKCVSCNKATRPEWKYCFPCGQKIKKENLNFKNRKRKKEFVSKIISNITDDDLNQLDLEWSK